MDDITSIDHVDILKALAHPTRLEFLNWMREPEKHFTSQLHPLEMGICSQQFEKRCGLSQSTVSAHLAALDRAGLVEISRVGQWSFYRRNEPAIQAFLSELKDRL
ncbi:ArsR/SmtB family transcription factor [Pseudorhizobium flavum]|jgi:DNA-binding transcriptional ArsR family regulator|uniref:ArsR/SmtB family transcription factor n=1 Tax=Pseudorhizobium flavum TaxID=1335061 RepID=UPI0037706B9F